MEDDAPITIEEIKAQLAKNPPGQGCLGMNIEFMYDAPFYISFLLDVLDAPARKRKGIIAQGGPRSIYVERTKAAGWTKTA